MTAESRQLTMNKEGNTGKRLTEGILVQKIRLTDLEAHVAGHQFHDVLQVDPVHDEEAISRRLRALEDEQ